MNVPQRLISAKSRGGKKEVTRLRSASIRDLDNYHSTPFVSDFLKDSLHTTKTATHCWLRALERDPETFSGLIAFQRPIELSFLLLLLLFPYFSHLHATFRGLPSASGMKISLLRQEGQEIATETRWQKSDDKETLYQRLDISIYSLTIEILENKKRGSRLAELYTHTFTDI